MKVKVSTALAVEFVVSSVDSHRWKCKDVSFCAPMTFQKVSIKMWGVVFSQDGRDWKACRLPLPGDFQLWLFLSSAHMGCVFCLNLKWHCLHLKNYFDLPLRALTILNFFCNLDESEMTLFTFYNSVDLPLKPVATFGIFCCKHLDSFLNLLLQLLMCFLNFVFSLNLKWHCSHFTNISTSILNLRPHF